MPIFGPFGVRNDAAMELKALATKINTDLLGDMASLTRHHRRSRHRHFIGRTFAAKAARG
jgi:hypothetical protein